MNRTRSIGSLLVLGLMLIAGGLQQPDLAPTSDSANAASRSDRGASPTSDDPANLPPADPLIPPLPLPGLVVEQGTAGDSHDVLSFAHDPWAEFEPHGEDVCASGCAASRHPTALLSSRRFDELVALFARQPMDQNSSALETLLYFGRQTRAMIGRHGLGALDRQRSEFLVDQLQHTHARIAIRVVDEHGRVRSWLRPTLVPLDRRHVFPMATDDLQPLVTSGTVKRVGLDHLWTRL